MCTTLWAIQLEVLTAIGMELRLLDGTQGAVLVGVGLLSVLLFPVTGLSLLRRGGGMRPADDAAAARPMAM
jgi:hypothetical protein